LPALIHYKPKEWGSNYSMVLIENLVLRWSKALIFTWFPEAKTQYFRETTRIKEETAILETIADIETYKDKQVLIIHDDDQSLCQEAIKRLTDINDRIIFIKNIDIVHEELIQECLNHSKIILSGNLDECWSKDSIGKNIFTTVILFSQPEIELSQTFIPLKPYTGQIRSKNTEGYVDCINE
jgi:hypothetical protein